MKHTIKVILSSLLFFFSYALYGMNTTPTSEPITKLKDNPNLILTNNVFHWITNGENISKVDSDNNTILHYFGKIDFESIEIIDCGAILRHCDAVLSTLNKHYYQQPRMKTFLLLRRAKESTIISKLPRRLLIHLVTNYVNNPNPQLLVQATVNLINQKNNNNETVNDLCLKSYKSTDDIIYGYLFCKFLEKFYIAPAPRNSKRKLSFSNDDKDSI